MAVNKYTPLQKIQAIEVMEQEGSAYAAEKVLHINRATLGNWKKNIKAIKAELETQKEQEEEALQVTGKKLFSTNQELYEAHLMDYTELAIKVRKAGLTKMLELINKATKVEHLRNVTDAVKTVHESIRPVDEKGGSGMNVEGDLFQTIVNQYESQRDGEG